MVSVAMICDIGWNPLIGITCDKFGADKGVILWCVVTIVSFGCLTLGAKIYSLVPAIGYALGCMGVPILTSIYQATGGYDSVWLFCAACDVAIALCVVLATRNSKKLPRTE